MRINAPSTSNSARNRSSPHRLREGYACAWSETTTRAAEDAFAPQYQLAANNSCQHDGSQRSLIYRKRTIERAAVLLAPCVGVRGKNLGPRGLVVDDLSISCRSDR